LETAVIRVQGTKEEASSNSIENTRRVNQAAFNKNENKIQTEQQQPT